MNKNFEGMAPNPPERPEDELDRDGVSPQAETFADDDAELAQTPKGMKAKEDLEAGDISREEYDRIMSGLKKEYLS